MKIVMEPILIKNSWNSKLRFAYICSVEILDHSNTIKVFVKNPFSKMSSANVTPTRDDSPKRSNHSRRKRNIASLTKSLQKLVNELQSGNKRTIEPSYFVQGITFKLTRILMEHIKLKFSLEPELHFGTICSIRVSSRIREI